MPLEAVQDSTALPSQLTESWRGSAHAASLETCLFGRHARKSMSRAAALGEGCLARRHARGRHRPRRPRTYALGWLVPKAETSHVSIKDAHSERVSTMRSPRIVPQSAQTYVLSVTVPTIARPHCALRLTRSPWLYSSTMFGGSTRQLGHRCLTARLGTTGCPYLPCMLALSCVCDARPWILNPRLHRASQRTSQRTTGDFGPATPCMMSWASETVHLFSSSGLQVSPSQCVQFRLCSRGESRVDQLVNALFRWPVSSR
jgi:hypothetical protein